MTTNPIGKNWILKSKMKQVELPLAAASPVAAEEGAKRLQLHVRRLKRSASIEAGGPSQISGGSVSW